jgi:death-on-curing protein
MENISVHVADNRIDKELLYEIIYSIINEDDFSEELRIKIIDATKQEEH